MEPERNAQSPPDVLHRRQRAEPWTETTLHEFNGPDGAKPLSSLIPWKGRCAARDHRRRWDVRRWHGLPLVPQAGEQLAEWAGPLRTAGEWKNEPLFVAALSGWK